MSRPKSLAERLEWMANNLPGFRDELDAAQAACDRAALSEKAVEKSWMFDAAQADFRAGLLVGAAIVFRDSAYSDDTFYTVGFQTSTGTGALVSAKTGDLCKYRSMDAAHEVIRKVGFLGTFCHVSLL
ncbi:hypothetical protein [Janthinobacterium sp. CG_S6]|uniref:hypothetical protein n=1 Tax=Janthinobacterium sp. CG_S6 TaxID=3071707 RepID=UPI002DF7E3DB|nr:hypothetical protein [Janthinobacterium sp. CG_S6]